MLLTLCYLLLGIVIIIYEIFRRRHGHLFDTILVFNAIIILYYIFPAVMNINSNFLGYSPGRNYGSFEISPWVFVCVVINYCIFIFIRLGLSKYVLAGVKKKLYLTHSEGKTTFILGIAVISFALLCFVPYANLFGGITNLLLNTSQIRGGVIESSNAKMVFLSKLFTCAYLAPVFMCGTNMRRHRVSVALIFLLAFTIMFSYGGRGYILIFLLIFILGSASKDYQFFRKISKKKIIIAISLMIFCILLLRPLFDSLRYLMTYRISGTISYYFSIVSNSGDGYAVGGGLWQSVKNLCRSFEHEIYSSSIALTQVFNGTHKCGFGKEFVVALLSLLPTLLLGISRPLSITKYNSAYIAGDFGILQVPSGFLAAGIYEFHILGLIICPILLAIASFFIDRFYYRIEHTKIAPYLNMVLLFLFKDICLGGDLASSIPRNFTILLFLFVLRWHLHKRRLITPHVQKTCRNSHIARLYAEGSQSK